MRTNDNGHIFYLTLSFKTSIFESNTHCNCDMTSPWCETEILKANNWIWRISVKTDNCVAPNPAELPAEFGCIVVKRSSMDCRKGLQVAFPC